LYSPEGATLFDFSVIHSGSKLSTGALAVTTCWLLPLVDSMQCGIEAGG